MWIIYFQYLWEDSELNASSTFLTKYFTNFSLSVMSTLSFKKSIKIGFCFLFLGNIKISGVAEGEGKD